MNRGKFLLAGVAICVALLLYFSARPTSRSPAATENSLPTTSFFEPQSQSPKTKNPETPTDVSIATASSTAAELNAPTGTIGRDLQILNDVFTDWRLNFPRSGNPIGDNAEITAALIGDNPLHLPLIPSDHRAIDPAGELRDRWGTPFRFHALSGQRMEIRSAGPDRKFGTDDDTLLTPP